MKNGSPQTLRAWVFWLLIAVLFLGFLYTIKAVLLPFVVGILVAYFLDPAADRLEKWGCSRGVATSVIVLSFFSVMIALFIVMAPLVYRQLAGLLTTLPDYVMQVRSILEPKVQAMLGSLNDEQIVSAQEAASGLSNKIVAAIGGLTSRILDSGFAIVNAVSVLVITPVVSFYLLRDWDRLVEKMDRLLPRAHADTIREQLAIIDETISGFVRGTLNVMIVLGLFYVIALTFVGLKFAILIGVIGGVMIIIPYLGTAISGLAAVGMAYLQFEEILPVAGVLAIFVAGQVLEGYILTPKLVGERVGLHPVWLIFGMLVGATLFGFVGIFIAVPVTAVIGVLVRFAIKQYQQSSYYKASARS